jgi:hypothetical protein
LLPRERKTANCFGALEAIHNRSQPGRRSIADEVRLRPQRTALSCQATAAQQRGCHRACKERKPPHNKATPVMTESPHSDQCPRRAPHFQPNTTTSPVSKAPAAPLLRLFSADAWKSKNTALRSKSSSNSSRQSKSTEQSAECQRCSRFTSSTLDTSS